MNLNIRKIYLEQWMKDQIEEIDPRSQYATLSSCEKKAWKKFRLEWDSTHSQGSWFLEEGTEKKVSVFLQYG